MLIRFSLVFSLVQIIFAKGTGCSACDSLKSIWNPDTNKGSCVGKHKQAEKLIINFQKCICDTNTQNTYRNCTECNLDPTGGVPIDGLNFGPLSLFRAQCLMFKNDVDTILKPSGLAAFINLFESDNYTPQDSIAEQDILAIEILSAIPSSVIAQATRTTASKGSKATSGKATPARTDDDGNNTSDSGRILPTSILFSIVTLAVTATIFL
jgi:hypothetical protein